jgi:hypothetical protein
MRNFFLLIGVFSLLSFQSCSKNESISKRKPNSVQEGKVDLIELTRSLQEEVAAGKYAGEACLQKLTDLESKIKKITPVELDPGQIEADGKLILDEMFNSRLKLHALLENSNIDCRNKIKKIFLSMRSVEDLLGVLYYKDEQISADKLDYKNEKMPVFEKEFYRPYHSPINLNTGDKFEFKNGDIMITKGISFVSSTISELAIPRSLFSHIVFVHVDQKTKEVTTIESYVGKGVAIYPIEEALKNENSRILVLRPKDSKLANEAANYMFDKVQSLKAKNKFIPYDYNLDFTENAKLSCEEVAYDAFKTVSQGKFIIPDLMSDVNLKDDHFLGRIGIKRGQMMVPGDMESDSRFDIVMDWTDYRIMRDSWRKDAVLGEIFRWSDEYLYSIHENFNSIAARLVWSTRYIPGVWNMMAKVSGLPVDFTKDVPTRTIATMASLKSIGNLLLPELSKVDEEYHQSTGLWMSSEELRKALNSIREKHPSDLEKLYRPKK